MTVAAPMIHLNGSGKENLIAQWRDAHTALSEALKQVSRAYPHMRDYYPMENGDAVYRKACEDHDRMKSQLRDMLTHYEQIAYAIMEMK